MEPLPRPVLNFLRERVLELRTRCPRSSIHPVLNVGVPGHADLCRTSPAEDNLDQGLRASLLAALLEVARSGDGLERAPWVWVERGGVTDWHDLDADWLPPTLQAYAEGGLPATFVVVTRNGWVDPRSGVGRWWKRLRVR